MGDPKKRRSKYSGPSHPWQKERIEEEKKLLREYGLKNKKELWRLTSLLRNFTNRAKKLVSLKGQQAEKEKSELLKKVTSLNLVKEGADLDDVLGINIKSLLDRRLQTLLHKKGMARSIKQSRQFIVHEHVTIGDKKMTVPSYIVSKNEENFIGISGESSLAKDDHPERVPLETKQVQKKEEK